MIAFNGPNFELEKQTTDDEAYPKIKQVSTAHEDQYYSLPNPQNRFERRKKKALERKLKGF